MIADLRYAVRQLLKSPGLTAVVVLSLALGIAANATVLCWLYGLVLKPLPGVERQDQIVVLVSNQGGGCVSIPDLNDFAKERAIFSGTEASMPTSSCLTVDRHPEWIQAEIVTAGTFDMLGVKPILGRTFLPDEDKKPGGNPVLVISETLWRRLFDADPAVLGRVVDLNRHSFTIVGVLPAAFHGTIPPANVEAWAPASMIWEVRNQSVGFLTSRNARGWLNLLRLQPGVTVEQARAAVETVNAQLTQAYPATNTRIQHRLLSLSKCPWGVQTVMGPLLWLLLAVSIGILLIVTANVANLLLARAVSRRKEIAIRLAAGASRGRLIRQFLIESALFALLGGVLGALLASWAVDFAPLLLPDEIKDVSQFRFPLNSVTLGLTFALTLASGLIFGLAPALQASKSDLNLVLKESGRGSQSGLTHHRLRNGLVVIEVAVALVLLIGAGLCVKGLGKARNIDIGFQPDQVLLARMQIGMNGYNRETGLTFYRQVRQRLAELPGVEEAALASWFPLGLSGCKGTGVFVEGYERPRDEEITYEFVAVSPRYFATLRIPFLAGRDFTDQDDGSVQRVTIVNEAFAKRFWPGQNALGRRFQTGSKWHTIVGIVKTGKYNRLEEAPRPFFYVPSPEGVPDLDLDICVRTTGNPSSVAGSLRQAIHDLDPGVEIKQVQSLATYSSFVLLPQQFASKVLMMLGLVALGLAAMGVYAVMAYAISQRTQEFGLRMALGARPIDVLRSVLRQGFTLALGGLAIGFIFAFAVTHLLTSFLYGVSPFDPAIFTGVASLLALVALLASWLPARRATRVDPIIALRSE